MGEKERRAEVDGRDLAGLSYRQVNDWEAKGALSGSDGRGTGWRKFSPRDVFALIVCSAIRQRFGVPLEKVKFVQDFMRQDGADHLRAAVEMMRSGLTVYLLTDFPETFIMDSDLRSGSRQAIEPHRERWRTARRRHGSVHSCDLGLRRGEASKMSAMLAKGEDAI